MQIDLEGNQTQITDGDVCLSSCAHGDGGPAKDATIKDGRHLAVAADGSLYVSDYGNHRIRRIAAPVTPDSIITTVVGTGTAGSSGDGAAASSAQINNPEGLAFAPDGSLYFADSGNLRVRRVGPDGKISTVAGVGTAIGGTNQCQGHYLNPVLPKRAIDAQIGSPTSVTLGPDGSIYIASNCDRIYRVTTDGWLHHVAGCRNTELGNPNCPTSDPKDGALATQASVPGRHGLAVSADGSIYVSTGTVFGTTAASHRIRRIAPDGRISTVAGDGTAGSDGDGGPAAAARLDHPHDLASDAAGRVYVADFQNRRVRRIESPLPGYAVGGVFVPSSDGAEFYEFDAAGRHLRTLDARLALADPEDLENATLLTFSHTEHGLASIADADGNTTTVERDANGTVTALVGPYGDRTELSLDAQGWLDAVENPAGETYTLVSSPLGLLTALTTPREHLFEFAYDALGRLERDDDPAGGFQTLARTETTTGFSVAHETALGFATHYGVDRPGGGAEVRTVTDPAGLVTTRERDRKFVTTTTTPAGMQRVATASADPRLGFAAAFTSSLDLSSPSGLGFVQTVEREVEPATGPVLSQTDTIRRSTLPPLTESTIEWDAVERTRTLSTFEDRESVDSFDVRGRLESSRIGTLHPTRLTYDARGRVESIAQGPGTGDRTTTFAYDTETGRLASITDPASRVTTFDLYDNAGRVLEMTLPGSRTVAFAYDANGNLTSLTPPGKPAHVFRYTPVDLESEYEPPALTGIPDPETVYTYNVDRQLDLVTRPDTKTIDLAYDEETGQLESVTIAEGVYAYGYYPATPSEFDDGQLASISAPEGELIAYEWDGDLPLSTTWDGTVEGSVTRTFDDEFRVLSETIDGAAVTFGYDADGLLTSAGSLAITRNGQAAGLISATSLGVIETIETASAFGELEGVEVSADESPLYSIDVSDRDALGRIETKTEVISPGASVTTTYGYDAAGRLETVTAGSTTTTYTYDANGNRTHVNSSLVGVYDDQDRLTSYAGTTYTYTAGGDLATKVDGSGTTTYAYDALGNLRTATLHVGTPQQTRIEYVIDGHSRRVGKKVCAAPCDPEDPATLQQGFLYADQLRIVAELDGSNEVVSRFVYGTKAHVPDYMVKGGVTYRILSDHVGSVRLVANATTGVLAQRIDYDAFGNPTYVTGSPDFQPFGFAGGLTDRDTGLVRFGARDYDPRVGRWTSKDPIRFSGMDSNLFAYALGDPINAIDPSGKIVPLALAVAGAAIATAAGVAGLGSELALFFGPCTRTAREDARRARDQAVSLSLNMAAALAGASVATQAAPALARLAMSHADKAPAMSQVAADVAVPGPSNTPIGAAIQTIQEVLSRLGDP